MSLLHCAWGDIHPHHFFRMGFLPLAQVAAPSAAQIQNVSTGKHGVRDQGDFYPIVVSPEGRAVPLVLLLRLLRDAVIVLCYRL